MNYGFERVFGWQLVLKLGAHILYTGIISLIAKRDAFCLEIDCVGKPSVVKSLGNVI